MSFVSLKRYLNRSDQEVVLRQIIDLLLDKVASGAVAADESEAKAFRADLEQIRNEIGPDAEPGSLLVAAGSAAQALEAYNRRVTRLIRKQAAELHNIVTMMTDAASTIGGENMRSVQRLQEIGDGLERAGSVRDFAALKVHLAECLNSLRVETLRQREESESLIENLRQQVERYSRAAAIPKDIDHATGLSNADAGIKALQQPAPAGLRRYVVTMVVGRIQSINARFGLEAGDRVLAAFGAYVQKQLGKADQLFRWKGPAFVALLDRTEPLDQVRSQVRRMLEKPVEETFEIGDRSVLIPILAAWTAFQLITTGPTAERQIQTFIASQGNTDYV
jgi:GGDEF domain-containing protein